jgi:antitoxin component of RelBE/YafQ-DinJ toxin-antitoxin module
MSTKSANPNALPIAERIPNATTVKAMRSADQKQGKRFRSAKKLFADLDV